MFFVYKNRFLARQIGNGHGFISDNISAHVHLLEDLEDNDPEKNPKMAAVSWVFSVWLIFHKKQQECFSEDHYRFISVNSVGREKSKLFQVVVLILEAAITFFFCSNCNDNSVHAMAH